MRLLQRSVRNAFAVCVLLGFSSSVYAGTWEPAFSIMMAELPVQDISFYGAQRGYEKTSLQIPVVYCYMYNTDNPTAYAQGCEDSHTPYIRPTCTVNGMPYFPGITVRGVTVNLKHGRDLTSSYRDVTEEFDSLFGAYYISMIASLTVNAINPEAGQDSLDFECTYSFPSSVKILLGGLYGSVVFGGQIRIPFSVTHIDAIDVSVEQPSPVIGKLMREFDAPFKMTVENVLSTERLSMTWDVGAPCDSWSPSLRLPDGSVLGIHHADSGRLPSGTSTMTAKFTPTALGAFSCTGTLNVSVD
ncbi:TPA: hypothetical protein OMD89_002083 [Klebsiella oxytoca]|nr:hypothetical protein [Klebsiella oxytoca]HCQ8705912.1 hypothetical protein [Klebsiella oxytoca]